MSCPPKWPFFFFIIFYFCSANFLSKTPQGLGDIMSTKQTQTEMLTEVMKVICSYLIHDLSGETKGVFHCWED